MEFFMPMRLPTKTHHDKKLSGVHGKAVLYDSPELKDVKAKLVAHLASHSPKELMIPPIHINISYIYQADDEHPEGTYKITKPDLDNLTKALLDSMKTCKFFKDDGQVATLQLGKWYHKIEGILISIKGN